MRSFFADKMRTSWFQTDKKRTFTTAKYRYFRLLKNCTKIAQTLVNKGFARIFKSEPPGTRTPEVTLKPQKNKGLRIIKK